MLKQPFLRGTTVSRENNLTPGGATGSGNSGHATHGECMVSTLRRDNVTVGDVERASLNTGVGAA